MYSTGIFCWEKKLPVIKKFTHREQKSILNHKKFGDMGITFILHIKQITRYKPIEAEMENKTTNKIINRLNMTLQTIQIYFKRWKIKGNQNKT